MRYFHVMIFMLKNAETYTPDFVDTVTVDAGEDLEEFDDIDGLDEATLAAVTVRLDEATLAAVTAKCLTFPDDIAGLIHSGGSIEYKLIGVPIGGTLKPFLCFTAEPAQKPKKPKKGLSEVWPRYGEH